MMLTRQRSRTDGCFWYRYILIASIVSSGLALLFEFIGFVTPSWIVLVMPSKFTVSAGVWYIQVCHSNSQPECRTASMTRVGNPFNVAGDGVQLVDWIELQVEVTVSFVSCIASLLLTVNAFISMSSEPKTYLAWAVITASLSAGLLMIPIGRLLDIIRQWDSHVIYAPPYSLIFSGLGCVCVLISAILNLFAICMILRDRKMERINTDERDDLTLNTT